VSPVMAASWISSPVSGDAGDLLDIDDQARLGTAGAELNQAIGPAIIHSTLQGRYAGGTFDAQCHVAAFWLCRGRVAVHARDAVGCLAAWLLGCLAAWLTALTDLALAFVLVWLEAATELTNL
jgi:hypothetical protein